MPAKNNRELAAKTAAIAFVFTLCLLTNAARAASAAPTAPASSWTNDDAAATAAADITLPAALCQVVYPLDESPEEGYRYMFLGNGFFVNEQGYVITAAHLLSYFRNGGLPYILVGPREGPRRMIEAPIVSADWDHDVAILRATPNPFQGEKKIAYLPLSAEMPGPGSGVLTASLRPADLENARSFRAPLEDFSRGEVIRYQLYRENAQESGERELMLFNQPVLSGQSGSPLLSADSHAVVGIVVGRWLHPVVIPSGNQSGHETMSPGAALRIHYAIGLLEQLHVGWHKPAAPVAVSEPVAAREKPAKQATGFTPPVPLSVVSTRYPPRALYGGEVLLDGLVDSSGKLTDVRVIAGDEPFLDTVLEAVGTWSFTPARKDGRAVEARVGIVFQFPQSFLPHIVSREHKHPESLTGSGDRAALPALSVEPEYPPRTTSDGTVAFYGVVDSQGQLASTSVLRDIPTLTEPVVSSAHQWLFAPAERDGAKTDSALVVVVTFRRPTP